MTHYRIIFALLLLLPLQLKAQTDTSTVMVKIDHSDVARGIQGEEEDERKELIGNVELRQDSTFLYADSAAVRGNIVDAFGNVIIHSGDSTEAFSDELFYNGDEKIAELRKNVLLIHGKNKIISERLIYDITLEKASYVSGALLQNDSMQITSRYGQYYTAIKSAFFKDNVVVLTEDMQIKTDSLFYNVDQEIVHLYGPSLITLDTAKIYAEEGGTYHLLTGEALFYGRPQYESDSTRAIADTIIYSQNILSLRGNAIYQDTAQYAVADTIVYDRDIDIVSLLGNAFFRDNNATAEGEILQYNRKTESIQSSGRSTIVSDEKIITADTLVRDEFTGLGYAVGDVIYIDTLENLTLLTDRADFETDGSYLKAYGSKKPVFLTVTEGDSVWITADTLVTRTIAYADLLKQRTQSSATDSMSFMGDSLNLLLQTSSDSTFLDSTGLVDRLLVIDSTRSVMPDSLSIDTIGLGQDPLTLGAENIGTKESAVDDTEKLLDTLLLDVLTVDTMPTQDSVILSDHLIVHHMDSIATDQFIDSLGQEIAQIDTHLINQSESYIDSLQNTTIDSLTTDPVDSIPHLHDTTRIIIAYHDVKLLKSDAQAICDSLLYVDIDSIFYLYQDPVVWSDSTQFEAEQITIQLENQAVDEVNLREKSFILTSQDLILFDQIKGRDMDAFMDSNTVDFVHVLGNSETIYYAKDDEEKYIGVNQSESSEIFVYFQNNGVAYIDFMIKPTFQFTPISRVLTSPPRLEGYNWRWAEKPDLINDFVNRAMNKKAIRLLAEEAMNENATEEEIAPDDNHLELEQEPSETEDSLPLHEENVPPESGQ